MSEIRPEDPPKSWRLQTKLVRGGLRRSQFGETSEAIYMTSSYVYPEAEEAEAAFKREIDRFIYSRYGNPTVEMFQDRMRLIEDAPACRATATGMAAVFASLVSHLKAGDRVVGARALFGSCLYILQNILPRYGIETVIIDGTDLSQWEQALSKPAACVFMETPSNPTLEIIDLARVCELAHAAGAMVIVDNVFASPVLQRPMSFGVDVVVYSATKHIDGQGRCLGGAILGSDHFCEEIITPFLRQTGPSMSPFNAWVLLKGLETLELRVKAQCAATLELAEFLMELKGISNVRYPGHESHPQFELARKQMSGFGSIVTFEVGKDKATAFRFVNALKLIDISNNLGDAKSLICHPATTTHQRLTPEERADIGITDGVVRLSVGLEDVEDLKEDIVQALAAA